jgi:hypothetical protein
MESTILSLFISTLLIDTVNISVRFNIFIGRHIGRPFKILTCFPCFSFWLSVFFCLTLQEHFIYAPITYLIAKLYDQWTLRK